MRVLITGSSGYLGSLLSNFLISKEIPVTGISFRRHPDIAEGNISKTIVAMWQTGTGWLRYSRRKNLPM